MMKQQKTDAEAITRYNCPVGVTFDAVIVIYDKNGIVKATNTYVNNSPMVFKFDGNARKTLGTRYREWKGEQYQPDDEGILWSRVTEWDSSGNTHIDEAIDKAVKYVPVAPTGAEFKQKLKLIAGEIDGLMPILPLTKVKIDSLNIPRYEDEGSYNNYNYLGMKMKPGDSTYTYYFSLSGYNAKDFPYFGFSVGAGHWEVVDENGDEWTGDDAPVKMGMEKGLGYETVNAVKPGVCRLKYCINEDEYNTSTDPDLYAKNEDLTVTPYIKVTVSEDRKIEAGGSFQGYVGEEQEALDAEDKLYASVCDASGKEIDADVTWEAKELPARGITVDQDGNVTFKTRNLSCTCLF
jgi:hypothetical protein